LLTYGKYTFERLTLAGNGCLYLEEEERKRRGRGEEEEEEEEREKQRIHVLACSNTPHTAHSTPRVVPLSSPLLVDVPVPTLLRAPRSTVVPLGRLG
jgi:hypothetical protein